MQLHDTTEVYRDIVGHEGHYQVSNLGNIRNFTHEISYTNRWGTTTTYTRTGQVLRPALNGSNYLFVNLYKPGQERNKGFTPCMVHTLVARAFLGPRPTDHDIHHKDENRWNNRADNLEYKLAFMHTSEHQTGNIPGNAKLTMVQVQEIHSLIQTGAMSQAAIARSYGVTAGLITMIKKGKRWNR